MQPQAPPQVQVPTPAVVGTDVGREALSSQATQIVQQGLQATFGDDMMPARDAKKGSGSYYTDYTCRLYELGGELLNTFPALAATLVGGELYGIVRAMPPGPAGQRGSKWPTTLRGYASQFGQFVAYVRDADSGIGAFEDNPSHTDTTGLFTAGTTLTYNGVTVKLRMTHFCAPPLIAAHMHLLIGTPHPCTCNASTQRIVATMTMLHAAPSDADLYIHVCTC